VKGRSDGIDHTAAFLRYVTASACNETGMPHACMAGVLITRQRGGRDRRGSNSVRHNPCMFEISVVWWWWGKGGGRPA
jgi:hypothetical protein